MNWTIQTRWIAFSARIYRALLILYPADYRREYGSLMVQFFRDVSRDKYQRQGFLGVIRWWCKTLFDLALTVIEQRRKVKFTMSKSTFMQMTGLLLVIGGGFTALAAFSQLQPGDHTTYTGLYQVLIWLSAPGLLFIGLGNIALGMRLGHNSLLGTVGQWTLYISGIGALVMALGLGATLVSDSLWYIALGGAYLHMAALMVFGILHVRNPVLPIFRALPLQIASGLGIMLSGLLRTNSDVTNNLLSFLFFVGMGLAWLAIGQILHRQEREAVPATAQA